MGLYRKKPVVVEATRWWPGKHVDGVKFDKEWEVEGAGSPRTVQEGAYVLTIHEQRSYLMPGDWVITELDGVHHYPCKSDIFAASYEPC